MGDCTSAGPTAGEWAIREGSLDLMVALKITEGDARVAPPIHSDHRKGCGQEKAFVDRHVGGPIVQAVVAAVERHGVEKSHWMQKMIWRRALGLVKGLESFKCLFLTLGLIIMKFLESVPS